MTYYDASPATSTARLANSYAAKAAHAYAEAGRLRTRNPRRAAQWTAGAAEFARIAMTFRVSLLHGLDVQAAMQLVASDAA